MLGLVSRGRRFVCGLSLALLALVYGATPAFAQTEVQDALTATGVDISDYVTQASTVMGTIVVVLLGIYFAWLIVAKAKRAGSAALRS